jgi:molybdate/tungstate transport system ATP-binding protein
LVAPTENGGGVLRGTVSHWLNEGTAYRVAVDIDDAIDPLTVSVAPSTFDALGVESGQAVGVRIPPAAAHLIQ